MTHTAHRPVALFYPFGEDGSGVEAHRLGLANGLSKFVRVYSRNQFSRWECVLFLFDAIRGRRLYIRMNNRSANFNWVLRLLLLSHARYTIEINAPAAEDGSSIKCYNKIVQNAQLVVTVSKVLARRLVALNPACTVVPNGGKDFLTPSDLSPSGGNPHFLSFFNSHWPWQSIQSINRVARKLQQWNYSILLIDVNGDLKQQQLPSNVILTGKLSTSAYKNALAQAAGFLLEYQISQDPELGFYGDSLRYRDFWNTQKTIVIQGPKAGWAPQPQTAKMGIFSVEEFELIDTQIPHIYPRIPYTWEHAAERIHSHWIEKK